MSKELNDASITKLDDGRFRVALAYHDDNQVVGTDVESFDTFDEAVDFLREQESNPRDSQPVQPSEPSEDSQGLSPTDQNQPQDSPAEQ